MATVEQFEYIRKDYFLNKKTIRQIARERNIHRRLVRQAIVNPIPPSQQQMIFANKKLTAEIKEFIDCCIKSDASAPKKQRHTARRIYTRLVNECNFTGAEPTIRKYVGIRRRELNFSTKAYVPLVYNAGEEAEVDWYESYIDFPSGRRKIYFFQMRACYSGREFHMAFLTLTQQAFFEGHVEAFKYFGGVFRKIKYDNLTSAVKKVLTGRKRIETEGFTLLRSHYLFEAIFCIPGKKGAHEKGGVECGVGRFRRNNLSPVPEFKDLLSLNKFLFSCCAKDDKRIIKGKTETIINMWQEENKKLLPLPNIEFDTTKVVAPIVNRQGFVSIDDNKYSVPIKFVDRKVEARLYSNEIEVYQGGKLIAKHQRCSGKKNVMATLDHYLDLLYKKPYALSKALPIKQMRERGVWPKAYDNIWQSLQDRYGESKGNKQFIEILLLCRIHSPQKVQQAIIDALLAGSCDVSSVMMLLHYSSIKKETHQKPLSTTELQGLVKYNRAEPDLKGYDDLLI